MICKGLRQITNLTQPLKVYSRQCVEGKGKKFADWNAQP